MDPECGTQRDMLFEHYYSVSSFEFEAIANGLTESVPVNQSQLRQQLHQSRQVIKLRVQNRTNKHKIVPIPTGMEQGFCKRLFTFIRNEENYFLGKMTRRILLIAMKTDY